MTPKQKPLAFVRVMWLNAKSLLVLEVDCLLSCEPEEKFERIRYRPYDRF